MPRANQIAFVVMVCLVIPSLAGCLPRKPAREDIVGLWVEQQQPAKRVDPALCGYFRLDADGTFQAHSVPKNTFMYWPGSAPTRIDATGTWSLAISPSRDPFVLDRVRLHFNKVLPEFPLGFDNYLDVLNYGGERTLFRTIGGDPSNRIDYVRRDKEGCS